MAKQTWCMDIRADTKDVPTLRTRIDYQILTEVNTCSFYQNAFLNTDTDAGLATVRHMGFGAARSAALQFSKKCRAKPPPLLSGSGRTDRMQTRLRFSTHAAHPTKYPHRWCIAHLLFWFQGLLIRGANRVMVWCLHWCVYMTHATMHVHVHFLLQCWCSQAVRRLKCDSCALWVGPTAVLIISFRSSTPGETIHVDGEKWCEFWFTFLHAWFQSIG